jgi:uridine monophosphate synthetase
MPLPLYPALTAAGVVRYAADEGRDAFTLKSGATSPIYLDARRIISHPTLLTRVVDALHRALVLHPSTATDRPFLCGVPSGAVPFASLWGGLYGYPQLMVRKTAKAHGTSKLVEGDYATPADVVLVEDVVTTGGSVTETMATLNAHGLRVVGVASVFYRGPPDARPTFANADGTVAPYAYVLDLAGLEALRAAHAGGTGVDDADVCILNATAAYADAPTRALAAATAPTYASPVQAAGVALVRSALAGSKVCVAVDKTTTAEVRAVLEAVGPHVGLVKLHCDIIEDFDAAFVAYLQDAKRRHGFLVWEDRKFADIGATVDKQVRGGVHRITDWANIVSCHAVGGALSLPDATHGPTPWVVLIGELSCAGQLLDAAYTRQVVALARTHERVVGVVCQREWPGLAPRLAIVPGIKAATADASTDGRGQQYATPAEKAFADVFVVGRAVTRHCGDAAAMVGAVGAVG